MATWRGTAQPSWPGPVNSRGDTNAWEHQRDNDEAGVVRRGVVFESATAVTTIRYSNGDRWYLVSATTGSSTTITFGSATKNTGAENTIRNLTAGNVIAATAGGTLDGSATQSVSGATVIWKSDGKAWRRIYSRDDVTIPNNLSVSSIDAGNGTFSNVNMQNCTVTGSFISDGTAKFVNIDVSSTASVGGQINLSSVLWRVGTGSPEGVVNANPGSLYSRTDGGVATTLYMKNTGTGSTGWTPLS